MMSRSTSIKLVDTLHSTASSKNGAPTNVLRSPQKLCSSRPHCPYHLPFLLQIAAAPADCIPEMAALANVKDEQVMDDDDNYSPTDEQVAQEEAEEPLMMPNAGRWDRFLALVRAMQATWPQGEPDTDTYRKGRALATFNLAAPVCNDLLELKPTMQTWVPHILLFIVCGRQMVELGDPTRRSCDACESFGAMTKKLIKHSTCRRRIVDNGRTTPHRKGLWKQTFKVGFIQQAFTRACVRESLRHGEDNVAYAQRRDRLLTTLGKASFCKKLVEEEAPRRSIYSLAKELRDGPAA